MSTLEKYICHLGALQKETTTSSGRSPLTGPLTYEATQNVTPPIPEDMKKTLQPKTHLGLQRGRTWHAPNTSQQAHTRCLTPAASLLQSDDVRALRACGVLGADHGGTVRDIVRIVSERWKSTRVMGQANDTRFIQLYTY